MKVMGVGFVKLLAGKGGGFCEKKVEAVMSAGPINCQHGSTAVGSDYEADGAVTDQLSRRQAVLVMVLMRLFDYQTTTSCPDSRRLLSYGSDGVLAPATRLTDDHTTAGLTSKGQPHRMT